MLSSIFLRFIYIIFIVYAFVSTIMLQQFYNVPFFRYLMEMPSSFPTIQVIEYIFAILYILGFLFSFFKCGRFNTKKHYIIYIRLVLVLIFQTLTGKFLSETTVDTTFAVVYGILIFLDMVVAMIALSMSRTKPALVAIPYMTAIFYDIMYSIIYPIIVFLNVINNIFANKSSILTDAPLKAKIMLGGSFFAGGNNAGMYIIYRKIPYITTLFALKFLIDYYARIKNQDINEKVNDSNTVSQQVNPVTLEKLVDDTTIPDRKQDIARGGENVAPTTPSTNVVVKASAASSASLMFVRIYALVGVAILIVSIVAMQQNNSCDSTCQLPLHPWFYKSPTGCACAVSTFKCQKSGKSGTGGWPNTTTLCHDYNVTDDDTNVASYLENHLSKYSYAVNLVNCRSESVPSSLFSPLKRLRSLRFEKSSGMIQRKWDFSSLPSSLAELSLSSLDPSSMSDLTPLMNLTENIKSFECDSCGLRGDITKPFITWKHLDSLKLINNILGFNVSYVDFGLPVTIPVLTPTFPFFLQTDEFKLSYLYLDNNLIQFIPEDFGTWSSLTDLSLLGLSLGNFTALPKSITTMNKLTTMVLAGEMQLAQLPEGFPSTLDLVDTRSSQYLCASVKLGPSWYTALPTPVQESIAESCALEMSPQVLIDLAKGCYMPYVVFPGQCSADCYFNSKVCTKSNCGDCSYYDDDVLEPILANPTTC